MATAAASARSSWIGRGASWIGMVRRTQALASVSSRMACRRGSTRRNWPGPRRPRRTVSAAVNGMAPASDARPTTWSVVTAKAAGRRPFRSTRAPTRSPSAKTMAAGPSHGARKPAVRRRHVATWGCGERRRAGASGIAAIRAGVRAQPVVVSSSSASSSDSESEPSGDRSGPAASSSAAMPSAGTTSAVRPRTCSRLPRTVLISPLWEIERNGWASRQTGWVFVA